MSEIKGTNKAFFYSFSKDEAEEFIDLFNKKELTEEKAKSLGKFVGMIRKIKKGVIAIFPNFN